jgi:L-lactate dehydrogenase complex protein LldG
MNPLSSSHTTQDEFLKRIGRALGRSAPLQAPPQPPPIDESLVRLAGAGDDLVALFESRAVEVGMAVHRAPAARLDTLLVELLRRFQARTTTLSVPRLAQAPAIERSLIDAGIELLAWRGDRTMANQYRADVGITDVHAALAETGSLICNSDADHARGHSLATPIHVAIVRRSDLLPDLLDYMSRMTAQAEAQGPASLPSAQAIITGPSKTADIEGILITGVHGPEQVHILLLDDA